MTKPSGWLPRASVLLACLLTTLLVAACSSSAKKQETVTTPPPPQQAAFATGQAATPTIGTVTPSPTASPSPTPSASPTPSPSPSPTPTASPSPTPSPEPIQTLADGTHGYVVTSSAVVQAQPNTSSAVVAHLHYQQQLTLIASVTGEDVLKGNQTWYIADQSWRSQWYKVDGGYVYSAWVWLPRPGEVLPAQLPAGNRWVDVNLAAQTATLMIGNSAVYTADVTTGKPGFATPQGNWNVQYQVLNETMTSAQAGINNPAEQYDVKNVLFTQYFDGFGDALHLNYWQPQGAFGNYPTSHGCVGLWIRDAQYFWMFGETGMRVRISDNGVITQPPPTQAPAPAPTHTATPEPTEAATATPAPPTPTPAPALGAPRTPTLPRNATVQPAAAPALATPSPAPVLTPAPVGTISPQRALTNGQPAPDPTGNRRR